MKWCSEVSSLRLMALIRGHDGSFPRLFLLYLTLVKASREDDGSRPTIRRLSARLGYQDAKVDIKRGLVEVALRDKRHFLRLKQRREYVANFVGLRWKEST